MIYHHVCEHCGVDLDAHDYQHLARECYPRQIERLRCALRQIVAEADSDDGLTAWDGSDIARRALGEAGDASGSAS